MHEPAVGCVQACTMERVPLANHLGSSVRDGSSLGVIPALLLLLVAVTNQSLLG